MRKTYQIEDNWVRGYVEAKIKEVVEHPDTNIDNNLNLLGQLLGWANKHLYIGRGGNHIWISDIWKKRCAIISFNNL